jgi:hypothetical protein
MWVPDPAHRATHDTRHRSLFILQFGCNLLIFQDASRPRFTAKPLIGPDERQPLNQRVPGSSPGAPTNPLNHLEGNAALDPPKFGCWEVHGKTARGGIGRQATPGCR